MQPRIILITGASSGIGKACAEHLAALGHRVYGTSRRAQILSPEELNSVQGVRMLRMDVTDEGSVHAAVETLLAVEGRVDVLLNNAGFGIGGAIEDTPIADAQAQLDTNFFGMLRVTQTVLPAMRAQGEGLIINTSSIAGRMGIPYQAMYSASKFAIEGATEALALEVATFGIRVAMLEPGDFHTGFTGQRQRTRRAKTDGVYLDAAERALGVMERDELNGPSPDVIAKTVARILSSPRPRLRYPVGRLDQRLSLLIKRLLPSRLFLWVLKVNYKL